MKKLFYSIPVLCIGHATFSQSCPPATAYDFLDINNVKARINNGGDMWWDLINDAQYFVPKSGNVSSLFAGALWIGGIDAEGQLKVAAQTYRQTGNDFFPGPLDASGNVSSQTCQDFDRIWKINKSTIDSFTAGQFTSIPNSILQWPSNGNTNLPFAVNQDLAPFIDANGDGIYDPSVGDYPDVFGDQALWFVFNDKGNVHTETGGNPLGIEVQCTAYAYTGTGTCLYSTTLYHYKIINKGTDLDSVFVGLWSDPDLGCYTDDYIGCDSTANLGVVLNSSPVDAGGGCSATYGNTPPVLALDFLKGPTDENGEVRYMDHFMYYNNDFSTIGNPENAAEYYNYLQSVFKDGNHLTYGGNGYGGTLLTNYAFSGDPSDNTGWSECANNDPPGDRRMIMSSGPFPLHAGETQTLDFAAVWDNTSVYPCPSFSTIRDVANCVKDYFDANFIATGASSPSGINDAVNLFPNPVQQNSVLDFHVKNAQQIQIFDLTGRMISIIQVKNESTVELKGNFSKGVYLYKVTFNDQLVKTGKFIVQ